MANVEWLEIPFRLSDSYGDSIDINLLQGTTGAGPSGADTGPQWLLDATKCQAGSAKRVTRDNSPQNNGEIVHRHFKTGLIMQLGMIAANVTQLPIGGPGGSAGEYEPAYGNQLVDLDDQLMLVLDRIENEDGILTWSPTGHANRSMLGARWLGPDGLGGAAFTAVLEARENDVFTTVQFALLCQYPYIVDSQLCCAYIDADTPSVTFTQGGTTPYFPIVHLNASDANVTSEVTISCTNAINGTPPGSPLNMVYNPNLPGAVEIAALKSIEFDMFKNTAYFGDICDGGSLDAGDTGCGGPDCVENSPYDCDFIIGSAKAGIDVQKSDFWSLVPGSNTISISGDSNASAWVYFTGAYV
jgi:hypothetical protein